MRAGAIFQNSFSHFQHPSFDSDSDLDLFILAMNQMVEQNVVVKFVNKRIGPNEMK